MNDVWHIQVDKINNKQQLNSKIVRCNIIHMADNISFIARPPMSNEVELNVTTESKASDLIEKVNFSILGADSRLLGEKISKLFKENDHPGRHYLEYSQEYEKALEKLSLKDAVENLYLFEMAMSSNEAVQLQRLQELTIFFANSESDKKDKAFEANELINKFLAEHPTTVKDDFVVFVK